LKFISRATATKWDGNDKINCRLALANGPVYQAIRALA